MIPWENSIKRPPNEYSQLEIGSTNFLSRIKIFYWEEDRATNLNKIDPYLSKLIVRVINLITQRFVSIISDLQRCNPTDFQTRNAKIGGQFSTIFSIFRPGDINTFLNPYFRRINGPRSSIFTRGVTRQFYAKITFCRERDTTFSLKNW